jgi:hypothetical protein
MDLETSIRATILLESQGSSDKYVGQIGQTTHKLGVAWLGAPSPGDLGIVCQPLRQELRQYSAFSAKPNDSPVPKILQNCRFITFGSQLCKPLQ